MLIDVNRMNTVASGYLFFPSVYSHSMFAWKYETYYKNNFVFLAFVQHLSTGNRVSLL